MSLNSPAARYCSEGIFWFGVLGALGAAANHTFNGPAALKELSPVAISKNGKDVEPGALWWGSYAFGAVNLGYFCIGMFAGLSGSNIAKKAYMFGTAVMFEAFAFAWITKGKITGIPSHSKQAKKIAGIGAIFAVGCYLMPNTGDE